MERVITASDGPAQIDIEGVREAHIELVGGDVSVGATTAPSWLEACCLHGGPVTVQFQDGVLLVRQGPGRSTSDRASAALTVPPDTPVRVRTVSAAVLVAGLAGTTRVRTLSGEVTGNFLTGDAAVSTLSGDVAVEGVAGRFHAATMTGDITLTAASLHELRAKTMSGEIAVDLDPKDRGAYECETLAGGVSFRLTPQASVTVEAVTVGGQVVSDEGPTASRLPRRRTWTVGEGGSQLRIRTLSGDIVVLRYAEAVPA
jgi:hypothetical protein